MREYSISHYPLPLINVVLDTEKQGNIKMHCINIKIENKTKRNVSVKP